MTTFEDPTLRNRVRVFRDRIHAGEVLAGLLERYRGTEAVVVGIPAGGLPVATTVAKRLGLPLEIAVVSKITPPWNTEVGYGAVAFDGTVCLNRQLIAGLALRPEEVQEGIDRAFSTVTRRVKRLCSERPLARLSQRVAILVDDGLASGFTMHVAMKALRKIGVERIVVGVPTGRERIVREIATRAEGVYCANIRDGACFAVAEAYELWCDLGEEELAGMIS